MRGILRQRVGAASGKAKNEFDLRRAARLVCARETESVAYQRAAAVRRGSRVLIRSIDFLNPTARPAVGFLFFLPRMNTDKHGWERSAGFSPLHLSTILIARARSGLKSALPRGALLLLSVFIRVH